MEVETQTRLIRLSAREMQILGLIGDGRCTKEIAVDLHISIKTVETHRRHLMDKLEMFSIAELTKEAIRKGLTRL